jgi:phytoene dehydrogenase-like protein
VLPVITGGSHARYMADVRCPAWPWPARAGSLPACVIGAGFGGWRWPSGCNRRGIATTVIEAATSRAGAPISGKRDGFTFDAGPTVITDPACLKELWALSGHDMAEDVELMPVMPFYRLNWPDGTNFDYSNDEAALRAEIAKLDPGDVAGYDASSLFAAGSTRKATSSSAPCRSSISSRCSRPPRR